VAFPGEKPNETFQDVVPIIFTLDFLQRKCFGFSHSEKEIKLIIKK